MDYRIAQRSRSLGEGSRVDEVLLVLMVVLGPMITPDGPKVYGADWCGEDAGNPGDHRPDLLECLLEPVGLFQMHDAQSEALVVVPPPLVLLPPLPPGCIHPASALSTRGSNFYMIRWTCKDCLKVWRFRR